MNYILKFRYVFNNFNIVYSVFLKSTLILLLILLLCPSFSFGYKTKVHKRITYEAINKSTLDSTLKNIGFSAGIEQKIVTWDDEIDTIHEWLQYGSEWEDDITWKNSFRFSTLGERGVLYCHFYNPLFDIGYYDLLEDGSYEIIGESLLNRMNDDVEIGENGWYHHNEWSYQMARDLYYAALTGNSTQHEYWYMMDKFMIGYFQNGFEGKENMNHEEREQFFAWTFQALGHTLHLIQDASVPAHTRNDLHAAEPFEKWTANNFENEQLVKYNGYGSSPWELWKDYMDIPAQNAFIDTYQHPEVSTGPDPVIKSDELNQGLAQYAYANFLSNDSIYPDNPLGHESLHDLDAIGLNHLGDVILKEEKQVGDKMRSFFYVKNDIIGIDHFALCGLSWSIKQMVGWNGHTPVTGILYTVNDDLVHQDYASKLIPRAVGYSAGLLEYFFRGKIEVTAPDGFLYSIIDGSVSPQQFTSIKANLRNATIMGETEEGDIIYEELGEGELIAIAKYKERTNYEPDLSTDPPTESDRDEYFSYSMSEPISIESLDYENPTEVIFDFSNQPIPAGITDLYLQVVFRGSLGNEKVNAIAVGMTDLNEPMHICSWNSSDRVYLYGQLYTADQIRADQDLMDLLPAGFNIDPFENLITGSAFYSDVDAVYYHTSNNPLPPARYNRTILLTDSPSFNMYVSYQSDDPYKSSYFDETLTGVKNQGPTGEFENTQIFNFRGVSAHHHYGLWIYYPDAVGMGTAPWPAPAGDGPVTTEIYP